jgi:hypothetical protein
MARRKCCASDILDPIDSAYHGCRKYEMAHIIAEEDQTMLETQSKLVVQQDQSLFQQFTILKADCFVNENN